MTTSDDTEKIVVSWFLDNACTSNSELAIISDVCKSWRNITVNHIATEAVKLAAADSDISNEDKEGNNTSLSKPSCTHQLIITDMARELVTKHQHDNNDKRKINTDGNFCLAWFAPSGIQTVPVPLNNDEDSTTSEEEESDSNGISINANSSMKVTCCSEWRGYRNADKVLQPFGYSEEFIKEVFDMSLQLANKDKGGDTNDVTTTLSDSSTTKLSSHNYTPTYAVRGATLARPEGYCLCLDDDYIEHVNSSSNFKKPSHSKYHNVPCRIDNWMNDYGLSLKTNNELTPSQRKKKQNNLAHALLPRIVLSTRRKYPLLHRFAETDACENESEQHSLPFERRQRAVQFLNVDRSQAIKLITPKFDCGAIMSGPITMFLIGITTEDGCFISGRSSRFELGHLYPLSSRDMQFDMSPICIATGKVGDMNGVNECEVVNRSGHRSHEHETSSDTGSTDDSDEKSVHCLCDFDSGDPFNPKNVSVDDPSEDCIHHGATGPGLWHCYTAVFDGKDSIIRIDGCTEPKRTRQSYYGSAAMGDDDEDSDDADNPSNASRFVGSGILDGLSIGSDHQFDMSLCYGEIEGESGQGSIAELAVFKGRMPDCDIEVLEKYLMKKHGLLSVQEKKDYIAKENSNRMKPLDIEVCHLQEDEWKRHAHALIEQRRPWKLDGLNVPLRVAANHHSVAWRRTNDITGQRMRITRIGAKNSNGSSDW